ncbi:PEP-utilizing enzyme [Thalassotalea piscium]|uniref:Phosphohistidine swiveling domain-containing protein n=1 Tax=Thalassotalea piscium TaxID=1230533 RepID=A0A7X0TV99_9GAMM|nr:PEP-utilizing enzyme [Thalassotalea piscium]MBB6545131.1 phosphohistidine swiveling domain-containing protein [Thalassotalea piscium]
MFIVRDVISTERIKGPILHIDSKPFDQLPSKSSININLQSFDKRYDFVKEHLKINFADLPGPLIDLARSYRAVLDDDSFRYSIEQYLNMGLSVDSSLMAFYEKEIVPVFSPRITVEIFGLIRMLATRNNREDVQVSKNTIIVCYDLTLDDWFHYSVDKCVAIVFVNTSVNSHAYLVARSMNLPIALVETNINQLPFHPGDIVEIDPMTNDIKILVTTK